MTSHYALSKTRSDKKLSTDNGAPTVKSQSCSTLHSTFNDRTVVLEDDELMAMAVATKDHIDWRNVTLSARVGPSRWQKHGHDNEFPVFSRHESQRFDVLAITLVPGCIAEILNVLQSPNDDQYAQVMKGIFKNEFRNGEILHYADLDSEAVKKQSTLLCANDGSEVAELSVKRLTFQKAMWLSKHEEWCYLDAVHRSQRGGPHTVIEKFMTTMQPADLVASARTNGDRKAFHDVTCGYLLRAGANDPPDSSNQDDTTLPRETRVTFYAEFQIPKQVGLSRATAAMSSAWRRSGLATDKTIKERLLKLAQSTSRLTTLVRRQRLGLQVLADSTRFLPPTNTPCKVCTHMLVVAKLCSVCGHGVCGECSAKYERAHQPRGSPSLQVTHVRVCSLCMSRIDQAQYAHLTSSSLLEAHVIHDPEAKMPHTARLKELLQDALLGAPSPTRKESLRSVIKCVLDQEMANQRTRTHSSSSTTSINLTPTSSDLEYVRALDYLDDEEVVLRSDERRGYQLDTSGSDALPIPIPENEDKRLEAVNIMHTADLATVMELEILCTLVAREMGCTTSVIALIDRDQYYGIASNVPELRGAVVPRAQSMCAHTIMESRSPLVVPHPEADIRFSKFDSVDKYGVRFYCAFPLLGEDDQVVGSMCCVNGESVEIREPQLQAFQKLASTASRVMRVESQQRRRQAATTDGRA